MSAQSRKIARAKAWETRRAAYGPRGHAGVYRQAGRCARCIQLYEEIAQLKSRLSDQSLTQTVKRETDETA